MSKFNTKSLTVDAEQHINTPTTKAFGAPGHQVTVIDGTPTVIHESDWIVTYDDGSREVLSHAKFTARFDAVPEPVATSIPAAPTATVTAPAAPSTPPVATPSAAVTETPAPVAKPAAPVAPAPAVAQPAPAPAPAAAAAAGS